MPSKVPFKGFYVSFGDANIRIGRATADSNNFNSSCKTLISRIFEVYRRCLYKIDFKNVDVFVKSTNTFEN